MQHFQDLNIDNGVGDYRINRFRVYFKNHQVGCANLPADFTQNFKLYFEPNKATVDVPEKTHNGKQTLRFIGDIPNAPDLHDDWVYIVHKDPKKGFAAQTLKRNFTHMNEEIGRMLVGVPVYTGIGLVFKTIYPTNPTLGKLTERAIEVNQHHFLAGRRSWVIAPACDFDGDIPPNAEKNNIYALETSAIERISLKEYQLGSAMFDKMIDEVWTKLLSNYVRRKNFTVVKHRAFNKGQFQNGISWFHNSFKNKESCGRSTYDMCRIHTNLWP